jgi:hypothetical protein
MDSHKVIRFSDTFQKVTLSIELANEKLEQILKEAAEVNDAPNTVERDVVSLLFP